MGVNLGAFEKRLSALEQDQAAQTSQIVDAPEIDTSVALIFTRDEHRGVFVTIPYRIPGSTFGLRTILVKRSEITDADSYEMNRIRDLAQDITDADRALGKFQRRFDKRLKYDSIYDIIRIVSQEEEGQGIASNPAEEPEFSGYPGNALLTFTTPSPFQVPSNPSAADLVTQLDQNRRHAAGYSSGAQTRQDRSQAASRPGCELRVEPDRV